MAQVIYDWRWIQNKKQMLLIPLVKHVGSWNTEASWVPAADSLQTGGPLRMLGTCIPYVCRTTRGNYYCTDSDRGCPSTPSRQQCSCLAWTRPLMHSVLFEFY